MKKYFIIIVSLIVFSCTNDQDLLEFESVNDKEFVYDHTSKEVTDPVRLFKAWNSYSYYRGFNTWTRKFTVKVANLAFDKNVSIYHEKVDGNWEEIPLSFDMSLENGEELWTGQYRYTAYAPGKVYDNEFVVKYEVDGVTYWDNNGGDNYVIEEKEIGSLFADPGLNVSIDTDYVNLYYFSFNDSNSLNFVVDIKNIAPEKNVEVIFTTDGWQTKEYLSLDFTKYWNTSYEYTTVSPNPFGVERWTGSINIDPSITSVEYTVVYKVNGQEYWDNNFGNNYVVTRQ